MTPEETGVRVGAALDRLPAGPHREAGEELARALMALYGDGLARLVAAVPPGVLAPALDDPAVAGLLILHDLHPEPLRVRIGRALRLAGADTVEQAACDEDGGALTLRRAAQGCGSGCGDGDTAGVESALACHAPEVTSVVWERAEPAPALLQIGSRPPAAAEAR
ncbi:thioredoxin [Streptomyces yaizuensis]|uniref:Thioredoxin n=1 Tax=Streptomyces yaizuensis TaxID=2989713 RepID=A0ABQ5NZL4_9ACTN|nr:thioredoxin [Streptomyces sp. YSPA8]GLF95406.1 thioredoxin [Streptomyces sp. YSPA8]